MTFNNIANNLFREQKVVNSAVNYVVLADDVIINITDTAVPRTVTLPAPSSTNIGKTFFIKDTSGLAATNNITISGVTGTIDGLGTVVINNNYGHVGIYSDGTNYFVQVASGNLNPFARFKARKATAQAITNNVNVPIVLYDPPVFNIGSHFNETTGVFTAPRTGSYLFSGMITLNANPVHDEPFFLYFSINGSLGSLEDRGLTNFVSTSPTVTRFGIPHTSILNLTANDLVVMNIRHNSSSTPFDTFTTPSLNYFMGTELVI